MSRFSRISPVLLLMLAGCWAAPVPQKPASASLTPDERVAWEKVRRGAEGPCHILHHLRHDGWHVGERICRGLAEQLEQAREEAKEPRNLAVVVVESLTGPDPAAVKWVWDDAKQLRVEDASPRPDWAASLAAHLTEYQRHVIQER